MTPMLDFRTAFLLHLLFCSHWSRLIVEATKLQCFESRPDLCAPILEVTQYDKSFVNPAHIFLSPANVSESTTGPYIYSSSGELVWHGANITQHEVNNFTPCQIAAEEKLCMLDLRHGKGVKASGPALAVSRDLAISKEAGLIEITGGQSFDMHELNSVDNGAGIVTIHYMPRIRDLSSVGGPIFGYLKTSGFQEIDVKTGAVNFEWDALDHFDLSESHMDIGTPSWGDALSPESPWDYFHINSVDKTRDGDYIISARHTSTIAKISGKNGTVLWRLGGNRSDFTFEPALNFSSQHCVRLQSENDTSAVLSVFNNGNDGNKQTANSSSGLLLQLDLINKHASLIRRYPAPNGYLSRKKGSLQILPGGNAFTHWGGTLNVTEHSPDGSHTVFQANIVDRDQGAYMYRAWKANFTTSPITSPDVHAVATSKAGPSVYYVSWNGATEVHGWRVYAAKEKADDYNLVDTFQKNGFETRLEIASLLPWAIIEAVNGANEGIRNATPVHAIHHVVDNGQSAVQTWFRDWDQWSITLILFVVMCGVILFLVFWLRRTRKKLNEQNDLA